MVFHITEAKGREIQDIAKDSFRQWQKHGHSRLLDTTEAVDKARDLSSWRRLNCNLIASSELTEENNDDVNTSTCQEHN